MKSLEERSEENLRAINDLNEENQQSFDEIYLALTELARKQIEVGQIPEIPRRPIGFIKPFEAD